MRSSDCYAFWQAQLAGETPELRGEGFPEAGFYEGIWRRTFPNPNPSVGAPRRKVEKIPQVYALWRGDSGEWLCRVDSAETAFLVEGTDEVDRIFAVVARCPISFEEYSRKLSEYEGLRA